MYRLLLLFWLGTFGMLHAAQIVSEIPETVLPLSPDRQTADDGSGPIDMQVSESDDVPAVRHLYTSIVSMPERLFKGEIFALTLRSIVTTEAFRTLQYRFEGGRGLQRLNEQPERDYRDRSYFDRYYFKVTDAGVQLPTIIPYLTFSDASTEEGTPIVSAPADATVLNPPNDFCGVLAENFSVTHTKTTVYDKDNNILVFMADANRSNLESFTVPVSKKQNFESLHSDPHTASMTYYAVLADKIDTLRLSYFNLKTRRFERIDIPIEVDEDVVSTMSDLKPVEHSHNRQKSIVFSVVAGIFLILAIWKRSRFYLVVAIGAAGYAAWLSVPLRTVCIKEHSPIYLLPMQNATVFEITPQRYDLELQGHIPGYTKLKLLNNKIGWVKDEDICQN